MMEDTIGPLHASGDERRNDRHIRRTAVALALMTLTAAGLVVASLIWRDATHIHNANETPSQVITIGVTLAWGVAFVFFWGMKMTPALCYRRYLREIRSGLSRVVEGVVVRVEEKASFRDGLYHYGVIVNVGDLAEPGDERLMYWDARLGRPDLAPGDRVRAKAHGNDMIGLNRL